MTGDSLHFQPVIAMCQSPTLSPATLLSPARALISIIRNQRREIYGVSGASMHFPRMSVINGNSPSLEEGRI
jgi:hypothetical protein